MIQLAGFPNLEREVVRRDRCSLCGTCAGFCAVIEMSEDGPRADRCPLVLGAGPCPRGELCFTLCPFSDVFDLEKFETGLEKCSRILTARSASRIEGAQDGGVATALVRLALEEGVADAALITKRDRGWRPIAEIISSPDEAVLGAGSKYFPSMASHPALRFIRRKKPASLVFVGLPCQIRGMRKALLLSEDRRHLSFLRGRKVYLIGLFCTEVFRYDCLRSKLEDLGVEVDELRKMDVSRGKLVLSMERGSMEIPLRELSECVLPACMRCEDLLSEHADISLGSLGSEDGLTTILVRTERGEELLDLALSRNALEQGDAVDVSRLERLSRWKKRRASSSRS